MTDIDHEALIDLLRTEDISVVSEVKRQLARIRADQIVREARGTVTMPPPDLTELS